MLADDLPFVDSELFCAMGSFKLQCDNKRTTPRPATSLTTLYLNTCQPYSLGRYHQLRPVTDSNGSSRWDAPPAAPAWPT